MAVNLHEFLFHVCCEPVDCDGVHICYDIDFGMLEC
jgi:hypothetical protein